jgi:hypothetical protein
VTWRFFLEITPRIICKIEEIQSKNHDRKKKDISKKMIAKFDYMFRPPPASEKHPESETYRLSYEILPSYHDSRETADKPKHAHRRRESLRHESRETQDKGMMEIIPHSRPRDKHISEDIEAKKSSIIKSLSPFRDVCVSVDA